MTYPDTNCQAEQNRGERRGESRTNDDLLQLIPVLEGQQPLVLRAVAIFADALADKRDCLGIPDRSFLLSDGGGGGVIVTLSQDLREGYLSMIRDIKPDIAITLRTRPGHEASQYWMLSQLKRFDARVARLVLGRKWSKRPHTERISGVFVLEYGKSRLNPHWHGLIRSPDGDSERYRNLMKSAWGHLGWTAWTDTHVDTLLKFTDKATYILKELHDDSTDRVVFSNMLR